MDFKGEYGGKLRSCEEVLGMLQDGWYVCAGQFAGTPQGLFSSLHTLAGKVHDVTVQSAFVMGDYPFLHNWELGDGLLLEAFFFGATERAIHSEGRASFMPGGLGRCAAKKLAWKRPNLFWGVSSPPDRHGNFNIGLSNAYEMDMLEESDIVVIEVNEQAPRVFGDNLVPLRAVDYIVEHNAPVPKTEPGMIGDVENSIGGYAAELIDNGYSIQLGIGSIPDAVGLHLRGKKDLGVHTEVITDSMATLYKEGVVTNTRKKLWKNKIAGTLILGTQALFDFVDDNPAVELRRGSEINSPYVIAQNKGQCSVNSALSVDLTGAVSSESFGYRQFSATGGQFETAYGAQLSEGGKSIITLRSTARQDTISAIVAGFPEGTATTLSRNDVDYVVTEYGIAALRGRSIRDRVKALIAIAHPKFREALKEDAERLKIW